MPLEELTGLRDLTFSRWHRSLPDDCSWIDIDCCHYCRYCNSLLALFELVRSPDEFSLEVRCRQKVASITGRVGYRLQIPVFKIAYTGEPLEAAAVMQVGKPEVLVMQADELAAFINQLHDCEFCRTHGGGRFKGKATRHE
jgi:hypothetical protein